MQEKLLMLGGSPFQVPAIQHARERGYYVITCDYLPDNPGHQFAHEYHNCSTTDFDGILKVAQECRINGIVAYASDPSAPTAAYVAEKLGLPTNPLSAVDVLTNKDKFRRFLSNHGFRVPLARGFSTVESLIEGCAAFQFPVMVKPVDSSGSKGVSKVTEPGLLAKAFAYAMPFSRAKRVIMEEYVEKNGYQVAGDGFLVGGKLVFRSFANEHFNVSCNPFVPIGESWPYNRPARVHDRIHEEIQRALTLLGMQMGALNFDIRVDADDNPILMEIGPRNGGNLIPQVTRYATGVDMVDYTIESALGHDCSALRMAETRGFWSCFMVHSKQTGTVGHVSIDPALAKNNIVEQSIPIKPGDKVQSFQGSNGTLGTMILKYSSMDEMLEKMDNMDKYVRVDVKDA